LLGGNFVAKVLITARSVAASAEGKAVLAAAGHEIKLCVGEGAWAEARMLENIRDVDAAIIGLDAMTAAVIAAGAPFLKVVARNGAGYNNVDVRAATDRGIVVTLAPGANTISVCELVLGLMISLARRIPFQDANVHQGSWGRIMGCELFGKILGVIGTGHIGCEVIKRAHAFGMKVLAFDIVPKPELSQLYDVQYVDNEEIFRSADFITLHVPSAPGTAGMINAASLGAMKKTAFLINTARGELVDEAALYAALSSGAIAGYGADTLIAEPPPADHPLLSLANVIVTPHCGAYTQEAVTRCSVIAAQEVVRVLAGEPPLYAVTK
jgi:D-3-phosphoglycerate dehydrogenase